MDTITGLAFSLKKKKEQKSEKKLNKVYLVKIVQFSVLR
jgi:hypothetical protein